MNPNLTDKLSTTKTFGREWLRSPRRVGAVIPSSKRLAKAMAEGLGSGSGPVIELGPGTGVITRALLESGVKRSNLAAIELSESFAAVLRQRHPDVQVIEGDAGEIARLSPFKPGSVGHVICGLPVVTLPNDLAERILEGSFEVLATDGAFRLFTYSPRCPVPEPVLDRMGLEAVKISRTLRNLPPASVYELRRAD